MTVHPLGSLGGDGSGGLQALWKLALLSGLAEAAGTGQVLSLG